jgi:polysaccharide biosynthesis transport protein
VLIALGTLLCVLVALIATTQQRKLYSAGAVVRMIPSGSESSANQQYEASQRLARSYAEIYTRGAVSQRINQALNLRKPVGDKELTAQQLKDLDLLLVGAVTTDPRRSAAIANAGWRALDQLSTNERLVLIDPAVVPDSPSSPNLKLNLALSLVGGLILVTGLALVLNAIQRPIPEPEALEAEFNVPVLAVVPRLPLRPRRQDGGRPRPASRSEAADDAFLRSDDGSSARTTVRTGNRA